MLVRLGILLAPLDILFISFLSVSLAFLQLFFHYNHHFLCVFCMLRFGSILPLRSLDFAQADLFRTVCINRI
jgi:hypothetical protein